MWGRKIDVASDDCKPIGAMAMTSNSYDSITCRAFLFVVSGWRGVTQREARAVTKKGVRRQQCVGS